MDINRNNHTEFSTSITIPTFIWCFVMPSIHFFSLISNILCMIVFCSNIFIKKPIAIYFICLLISDSITLLIGYIEMIDRESNMIDKSSLLCIFNEKVIHTITDFIYTFMGRFCLEWMLYKVLWTRASTILLAILSIQRTRTFFSLSYHESRLCACFACILSILLAMTITCLEWTGVQYDKSNCSSKAIALEFYSVTRSLLSNRDQHLVDITTSFLIHSTQYDFNISNKSLLQETIYTAKTPEIIGKLFEKRSCQITLSYSLWLRFYDFLHSVSFTWNRRIVAIFFGNALPSFIVVLANLLSIKVIYFSNSLKYLKKSTRKNRRKRRLQNDLRAFLVILTESFSIILISWGIPILLTMYHCGTLYVVNIAACPKIKDYLALFLFTDLFNSSTNCLLYSLSGRLFRRKFICILKTSLTCGRGRLWHAKQHSMISANQPLDRQPSYNPSINTNNNNFPKQPSSEPGSYRLSQRLSSPVTNDSNRKFNYPAGRTTIHKRINGQNRNLSDDGSLSIGRTSDDQYGPKNSSSEVDSDTTKKSTEVQLRKNSQSIKAYFIDKVRSFGSVSSASGRLNSIHHPSVVLSIDRKPKKFLNSIFFKRRTTTDLSFSTSSFNGSISHSSQRKHSLLCRQSSAKFKSTNPNNIIDDLAITNNNIPENLSSV